MRANKSTVPIAACLGLLLMILDSKTALAGARDGVALATTVLIPSLFPFLFLSICLTGSIHAEDFPLPKTVRTFLSLPRGSEGILLSAFLGGYPAGAQAVSQAYHSGTISKKTAEKMLSFTNNAGPSFLFGMASFYFSNIKEVWMLWLFHIMGALTAAWVTPWGWDKTQFSKQPEPLSSSMILIKSMYVMSVICGWVILFRVIIAFADRWFLWILPPAVRTAMIGVLELSNGICELKTIADEKVRFLICTGMLSLGGVCVTMQTCSVTEGLDKGYYFRGKSTQLLVSLVLGAAWMYRKLYLLPLLVLPVIAAGKNKCGNPDTVGV